MARVANRRIAGIGAGNGLLRASRLPSAQLRDPRHLSGHSPTDSQRKFYCYGFAAPAVRPASVRRAGSSWGAAASAGRSDTGMFAARGSRSPRNQIPSAAPGFGGSDSPSSRTCFRPGPGQGRRRSGNLDRLALHPLDLDHLQVLARQPVLAQAAQPSVATVKESIFGSRTRRASENGRDLPSRPFSTTAPSEQPATRYCRRLGRTDRAKIGANSSARFVPEPNSHPCCRR